MDLYRLYGLSSGINGEPDICERPEFKVERGGCLTNGIEIKAIFTRKFEYKFILEEKDLNRIHLLDKASFESLFRSEFKGLCFFALQYTRDQDTAREITQEAFISLWEKRASIDLSKPVKTYLSTTVRNKCLNWLRDNKKFNREILDIEGLISDKSYIQPDRLIEAEIREKIAIAIDGLPQKCREIFVLNRYENLKYQEIANRLDISVKTVETQMSKALQHMRNQLAEFLK
jgi:RNA polymerase sigma-70 factor (ECF subfamily)